MKIKEIPGDSRKPSGVWEFFASVKLTVALLMTLAATSIIGTLIPQNESPENYRRAFGEFYYRLFEVLDFFDMYHSWWFQLLLLLLTVNLIVCSLNRLSATWKIVFVKHPKFNLERYRNDKNSISGRVARPLEEMRPIVEELVKKKFTYYRNETTSNGFVFFAEKWRWTRLGVYIVHASVVILLIGGLIGSIFGFEGFVNIAEGETTRTIVLRNSGQSIQLDFEIHCVDFAVSFYPTGMPKEYRSRLSIIENGRTAVQKDVLVNHPLRYKGVNIFQSSYGELPPEVAITSAPEEIALSFTSKETGMVYNKKVRIGERIKVPEGLGEFEIKAFKPTHDFRGRDLGPTLIGTLVQADGVPAEVILPFKFPGFDRMSTMTDPQRSDALMIALEEMPSPNDPQAKRFYTGLQVTKDPGVGAVYTGFVLMIIGCIVTFFMSHQRLCIEVTRGGKQSRVTVSGNANKNRFGMRKKVGAITGHLLEVDGGLQNTPVSTGQNTTGNSP